MRTQQEAERAEQQRIKNLVLNYDLTNDQQDGEDPGFHYVMTSNNNRTRLVGRGILNNSLPPMRAGRRSQHSTGQDSGRDSSHVDPTARNPLSPLAINHNARADTFADQTGHIDTLHGGPRVDKSGSSRSKQRARKLQLGDIDWYSNRTPPAQPEAPQPQVSLDDYIVDKKPKREYRRSSGRKG